MRNRRKNRSAGSNNSDIDSIEHLEDDDEKHLASFDDIDSVSVTMAKKGMTASQRKKKNRKKKKKQKKEEDDEKLVNCLYYGLMCCECSIS